MKASKLLKISFLLLYVLYIFFKYILNRLAITSLNHFMAELLAKNFYFVSFFLKNPW